MRSMAHSPAAAAHLGGGIVGDWQMPSAAWPDFLPSEPGRAIRVIIIDDDPHIRRVIAGELSSDRRTDLVGQASGMRAGRHLISSVEFDVMIVDLNLGDGYGFDLIDHMKRVRAQAEAIVVSVMDDDQHAIRAFELGATGFLVKSAWFGSFPQAVLQVVGGGASISPNLARRLLNRLGRGQAPGTPAPSLDRVEASTPSLSEREREVLQNVAHGYTSAEVAQRLSLSVQTVNTHLRNIYRKLGVGSRTQAVSRASSAGLF
jgi:DNA-binding NarL/FixJ family response regulator